MAVMAKQVNPPRGMRDFLPRDKAKRERALSVIRDVYRSHGFDEIETPIVEDYDRLHAGLGGDNEKLSFSILKRGITSDELSHAAVEGNAELLADLGLRFDLTVPLTRFFASHRAELPPVFRALQIAPVWRAERPQKGRFRQFVQADIDIIGEAGALAEIELITATSHALASLGLEGCSIRVNDRRILFGMLAASGFSSEHFDRALITVDKLDKIGVEGVTEELRALDFDGAETLGSLLERVQPALAGAGISLTRAAILDVLGDAATAETPHREALTAGVENLVTIGDALAGTLPDGVTLVFDPTLVRGMGYYTGTIFEISHPGSGSSVGGGGRYDGMVGRFLGQDVPAVGFSIGFERVVDLIDVEDPEGPDAVALVYDADVDPRQLAALKRELIEDGHRVRIERRQKNMRTLLDRLESAAFRRFATVTAETTSVSDLEFRDLTGSSQSSR